jgi:uncharacterized membrane protein YqhA
MLADADFGLPFPVPRQAAMLRPVLTSSRYRVLVAVLGSLVAAFALFACGVAETVVVIAALSYFLSTVKGDKA